MAITEHTTRYKTTFFNVNRLCTSPSGKTEIFEVISVNNTKLGRISWWAAWRKYCFMPSENIVFDNKCLSAICNVLNMLNERKHD